MDRNKIASYYKGAKIFMFPSEEDCSPNVVIEAMACGLPIVCFNNTSASDYISHKVNGFVVDDISSENLKMGIEWMSKKIEEKKDFYRLSKNQVEIFDPKIIAQQYIKLYSEVL